MNYTEFLKKYDQFDKYILFLLSLDFNVAEVARMCEVSRQTVYDTLERNKNFARDFAKSVDGVEAE